jgi:ribosomal protein S18 acetylase RimI-like enzyme
MKKEKHQIEICDASAEDAAEILAVQKLAFHGQGILYNDFTLPPLTQTLEDLTGDFKSYAFLKAMYKGKIVGSVRGRAEGDAGLISRLFVHPDYQNRGIGKKLMLAIENRFSVSRYALFTGEKSAKSLMLYEKLGYRECARKSQSATVTLICLEKSST